VNVDFTIDILREDGVDRSTVAVPDFPVLMIHLWMDVEERNHEHPDDRPSPHRVAEAGVSRHDRPHHVAHPPYA
jgi:hypothetical protein